MSYSDPECVMSEIASSTTRKSSQIRKAKQHRRKSRKRCIYKVKSDIRIITTHNISEIRDDKAQELPGYEIASSSLPRGRELSHEIERYINLQDENIPPRSQELISDRDEDVVADATCVDPLSIDEDKNSNKKRKRRDFLVDSFFSKKIQVSDLGKRKRNYEFDPYL